MKYAIVSDIHGNLPALEAVKKDIEKVGVDVKICLGDIVGYGAQPRECLDLIRGFADNIILGNHDQDSLHNSIVEGMEPRAAASLDITRLILTESDKEMMRLINLTYRDPNNFQCAHSNFEEPSEFGIYIMPTSVFYLAEDRKRIDEDVKNSFNALHEKVGFVGHSHMPIIYEYKNGKVDSSVVRGRQELLEGNHIINVGSVGQPRDRDNRACYVVYDNENNTVEFRRVYYDVNEAIKQIQNFNLNGMKFPDRNWQRLMRGQ